MIRDVAGIGRRTHVSNHGLKAKAVQKPVKALRRETLGYTWAFQADCRAEMIEKEQIRTVLPLSPLVTNK